MPTLSMILPSMAISVVTLVVGALLLVFPKLLRLGLAFYLIVIGLLGILGNLGA
jgi:hypothetical protein